jgi:hypothetical protein
MDATRRPIAATCLQGAEWNTTTFPPIVARFGTATESPLRELVANVESRRKVFQKS